MIAPASPTPLTQRRRESVSNFRGKNDHFHVQHIGITHSLVNKSFLLSLIFEIHLIGHFTLITDHFHYPKTRPSTIKSAAQLSSPRGRAQFERRIYPPPCANQRDSSWRGYLTSHITPCAVMATCLLITFLQVT